ncbi:MAG: TRAP transporter small permease subunit [Oscillospiraceae bacterium]|nr:TRAP transporter small permease subunit [Oscillospiraceae bacterium]
MQIIKKAYLALCKCRDITIILTVVFMVGLILMNIFLRYVASGAFRPFAWVDELIRNLSAWLFFLGASMAARERAHMSLDFLVKRLFKGKARVIVDKLVLIACLFIIGLIIRVGFQSAMSNPASMVNLPSIPMTAFFLAIPVGMSFVFVDFLLILIYGYHPFSSQALAAEAAAAAEKAAAERPKPVIQTEEEGA